VFFRTHIKSSSTRRMSGERFDYTAPRYGDDSTPLVSLVPEAPPSHWGKLTSAARTLSAAYVKFLNKGKEAKKDGRAG
jgi:hypothetical protein